MMARRPDSAARSPHRGLLLSALVATALAGLPGPVSAQSNACAREAAAISRAESQLPRLEVAPPGDQQIVCITLETNILFARRLAAHLSHCPRSPLARMAEHWQRTGRDYLAHFANRRCKPAIRSYRG